MQTLHNTDTHANAHANTHSHAHAHTHAHTHTLQDLKQAPVEALQVAARAQGAGMMGVYGTSTSGYAVLLAVNAVMVVSVVALINRRRRRTESLPLLA